MKKRQRRELFVIGGLILVTALAMVYTNAAPRAGMDAVAEPSGFHDTRQDALALAGNLVQKKYLYGSEGHVTLGLTMTAAERIPDGTDIARRDVDMVIVLDRSGSMAGEKIFNAGAAVRHLIRSLAPTDRIAVVTYSDDARRLCELTPVTTENLGEIESAVAGIAASGGTNLGGGLSVGLDLLHPAAGSTRLKKMVLISDGLANIGTTDPDQLGNMAAMAPEWGISLATVGVGLDFNEYLMTRLADRGTGDFYFLQNPQAFAEVFLREYRNIRNAVATSVTIRVPLSEGVELVDAGGYPISREKGGAEFNCGDFRAGQTRRLFLTFAMPADRVESYRIQGIHARYFTAGDLRTARLPDAFDVACVKEREAVLASIEKDAWTRKVLQEDYNQLKARVATHIKAGRKDEALRQIDEYRARQGAVNAVVASPGIRKNLEQDVNALNTMVNDTFEGEAARVVQKRKLNSKSLQFDSYQERRAKKP